jgi:hypothetical protein
MGQVLHGCATTTEGSVERYSIVKSLRALAKRYGINPKTVAKWKARTSVSDLSTGPRKPRSTTLSVEEEAMVVAFRRHTLLPLDDCLYALQPTIPHLTRSSLHRCLQRHGISRLPQVEGEASSKRQFRTYPIGFFHVDFAHPVEAFYYRNRTAQAAVRDVSSDPPWLMHALGDFARHPGDPDFVFKSHSNLPSRTGTQAQDDASTGDRASPDQVTLGELVAALRHTQHALESAEAKTAAQIRQMNEIEHSTSRQLTAPIRMLVRMIRR